jgi:hypothetical protein
MRRDHEGRLSALDSQVARKIWRVVRSRSPSLSQSSAESPRSSPINGLCTVPDGATSNVPSPRERQMRTPD